MGVAPPKAKENGAPPSFPRRADGSARALFAAGRGDDKDDRGKAPPRSGTPTTRTIYLYRHTGPDRR